MSPPQGLLSNGGTTKNCFINSVVLYLPLLIFHRHKKIKALVLLDFRFWISDFGLYKKREGKMQRDAGLDNCGFRPALARLLGGMLYTG